MPTGTGAADPQPPTLRVAALSKRYGSTAVLTDVSFDIAAGEVCGLVGTNGAGKSTLIKVLSGAVPPTAGRIELAGEPFAPANPLAASRAGVETVHQEIDAGVVPGFTVAENLVLDSLSPRRDAARPEPARLRPAAGWWRTARRVRREAQAIAARAGLTVDLDAPVESLPASERQQVVLARAVSRSPRLLILDEPTSSLSEREVDRLLGRVRELAAAGVAVLFVSHHVDEIERLSDQVVVLRDGRVRRNITPPIHGREVVEAMLGASVTALAHEARPGGAAILEARGVRAKPTGRPFDLTVREGEIVGLVGLVGSGKTELLEQLYGARPLVSGDLRLLGQPFRPSQPAAAVRAGVALVAEERGPQAVVPAWSIRQHVTLPRLAEHSRWGVLRRRDELRTAQRTVHAFGVVGGGRPGEVGADLAVLSGGNQQKVLVGRWFDGRARLVLLDEPFRGVDVGARADIVARLRENSAGIGVLVASSDPAEIVQVADRIVVIAGGNLTGELPVSDATTEQLSQLMTADDPRPVTRSDGGQG